MKVKKIILICILIALVAILLIAIFNVKKENKKDEDKLEIVASNFASYDFIREIIGNNSEFNLTFLLGPGKDGHSYDPTAQDLIKIQEADMFVYIGGEMEKWTPKVLESLYNNKSTVVCVSDAVKKLEEQEIDGAEPEQEEEEVEGAFDEHIWTSPENAIKMVTALENEIEKKDPNNKEKYRKNSNEYITQIQEIDKEIQNIVDNKVRDRLVFADKMPMQYFVNYYNLNVTAAFAGCSTETEPSASTIAYLVNKVKEEKTPVVLYTELNDGKVAQVICNEVGNGCQMLKIQSLHNVSKSEFDNGATWVSLMKSNIDVLKKALQ